MIKAVIFDMDGVLIDSEPLWRRVETRIYRKMGLPVRENTFLATTGLRIDRAVQRIYEMFPWGSIPTQKEVEQKIVTGVKETIIKKGKARDGVYEAIDLCQKKGVKIALASSTRLQLINVTLNVIGLKDSFLVIHSGEHEKHPKPEPDIYLTTARKLRVKPTECLAIEDSPVGIESAVRAGMRCIAIVDPYHASDPRYEMAEVCLSSLSDINEKLWENLNR